MSEGDGRERPGAARTWRPAEARARPAAAGGGAARGLARPAGVRRQGRAGAGDAGRAGPGGGAIAARGSPGELVPELQTGRWFFPFAVPRNPGRCTCGCCRPARAAARSRARRAPSGPCVHVFVRGPSSFVCQALSPASHELPAGMRRRPDRGLHVARAFPAQWAFPLAPGRLQGAV